MESQKRANEIGPAGSRVAENVVELRKKARITTRAAAAQLEELGRPILATGITKIEARQRRVDVDDLVALSLLLDATPNRLLLPPTTRQDVDVDLTATEHTSAGWAWSWAADAELPIGTWPPVNGQSTQGREGYERRRSFRLQNRPGYAEPNMADYHDHLESIVGLRQMADKIVNETPMTIHDVVALAFGAHIYSHHEG